MRTPASPLDPQLARLQLRDLHPGTRPTTVWSLPSHADPGLTLVEHLDAAQRGLPLRAVAGVGEVGIGHLDRYVERDPATQRLRTRLHDQNRSPVSSS